MRLPLTLLLPARQRPSVLIPSVCPSHISSQHRTLYIRPNTKPAIIHKLKSQLPDLLDKPITEIAFEKLKTRILETGGNLQLLEVLHLDKKYRDVSMTDQKPDYNEFKVKGAIGKSILGEIKEDDATFRNLMNKMNSTILKDGNLQKFLILELIRLKNEEQDEIITKVWTTLKSSLLKEPITNKTEKTILVLELASNKQFIASLIDLTLYFSNIKLLIQLASNNKVKDSLLKSIFSSLLVKNPRYEEYTIESLIQLAIQKHHKFSKQENVAMLTNKFNLLNPFLQKKFLEFIMEHTDYDHDPRKQIYGRSKLRNYYKLIDINFQIKNIAGCYITWCKILIDYPNIPIQDHDATILSKLMHTFNKSVDYQIVSGEIIDALGPFKQLNKDGNNEILLHNLISYFAKTSQFDSINELISSVSPPFQRRTLVELLKVNLLFKESHVNVEMILKQISNTFGGFSPLENSIIVKSLVKRDKFRESLSYTDSLEVKVAKNSYLTIVDHLINNSNGMLDETQLLIINNFLSKVKKIQLDDNYDFLKDPFWSMVSSFYFKYSCKDNKKLASLRNLYDNSVNNLSTKSYYMNQFGQDNQGSGILKYQEKLTVLDELQLNPFENPSNVNFLLINDESKIMILKTIYDTAFAKKDWKSINWCYDKFAELGLSNFEIMMTLNKSSNRSVGYNNVRSRTFERFTAFWNEKFPNFIKNNRS